uniref:Uncharacterized protein n=1 Tax=Anguilla anguilla TaxID=7936 RepID=A0A0E9SSG2_ANGAN
MKRMKAWCWPLMCCQRQD